MHRSKQNSKSAYPVSHSPHTNLGGFDLKEDRAAAHFLLRRMKIRTRQGKQVNDNAINGNIVSKLRIPFLVLSAFVLGAMTGINISVLAEQAVLHADDQTLSLAMDIDPEALAYALNSIDVGE